MSDVVLALGSFDGLHLGHKAVLDAAKDFKNRIALVFDMPPAMQISGEYELLLPIKEKHSLFHKEGFLVETLDFETVRSLTAEQFLLWLYDMYYPKKICCGFNYHFGKNGSGNIETLSSFCSERGIILSVCEPVELMGDRVSSSRIRALIKNGDVETANRLLSHDFSVFGTVEKGDMRGRTIGFPTVNFPYPQNLVKAKSGVYAAECEIDGKTYKAVCYIGSRPSFKLDFITVETHIIDFEGDLYGREIKVSLKKYLRDEMLFSSKEELAAQLKNDIKKAR